MPKIIHSTTQFTANIAAGLQEGTLIKGINSKDELILMVTDCSLWPFINLRDGVLYDEEVVKDYSFIIITKPITLEP